MMTRTENENLHDELARQVVETTWDALRSQLARDAVILLDGREDLLTVAVAVARDDKVFIGRLIGEGRLAKPDAAHLAAWETQLDKPFRMVIVQPFVLCQELLAS